MSLLLNLINYSSSMQSQYSLSLPTMDGKDSRSRSLCLFGEEQENKNTRMTSKSLSKLLNEKPQQNIDPKTRILHRIGHSLSIKCKKHYYAFFVTLQTLKKKDLYLTTEGQFEKMQSRKLTFNQKDTKNIEQKTNSKKKEVCSEEKKNILTKFLQKLTELNGLILIKEFEQRTKSKFFHSIKNNYIYNDRVNSLASSLQKCLVKLNSYMAFKNLKKINQYAFKIEILQTLLNTINKKYNKINPFQEFSIKENAFATLKIFSFDQKICVSAQESSEKSPNTTKISSQDIVFEKPSSIDLNSEIKNLPTIKQIQRPLLTTSNQQNKSHQDGYVSRKFPLQSLEDKVFSMDQRKFDRKQKNMLKVYSIKTCLQEEPMIVSKNINTDKTSNFCNKIPKNYLILSPNDQDQQFNFIFTSKIKSNTFSNRLKESKVTTYRSNKFAKSNIKHFNLDFSSDEKGEDFTISQISGIATLKTNKSSSTIVNERSYISSSAIGTQCVNFKNSLVQQRESLKDADKNFTKKKPANVNKSEVQGGVFTKSFLRSTIDNKTKVKLIEASNLDRNYSGNKASEFLMRQDGPLTDIKHGSRPQQINWIRPSSHGRQEDKKIETDIDSTFVKVNMSMISNQSMYPTRDISGIVTTPIDLFNRPSSYVPKQQNEKQKSFIKLLGSKKDTSMISKS